MSTTVSTTTRRAVRSIDGTTISYETLGAGEGLLVVGGALRAARDYLPFARALSDSFTVHVIDRRGRGHSGPQGAEYSIAHESEDLLAVQAETGATIVFGHSYGGLVALEAARHSAVFSEVVVYEPGVSIAGSIPGAWMGRYRERLAARDPWGAFATMARGAGAAPPALERMPLWSVKLILRLFIKQQQWQQIEPLLHATLAEHEQVAALDDTTLDRYQTIAARVLLLGGANSRWFARTGLLAHLPDAIPNCTGELINGLDHTAPDEKAPELIAHRVRRHLRG
jgi:pimeloyl-ACP methyl ester carboxylesterase